MHVQFSYEDFAGISQIYYGKIGFCMGRSSEQYDITGVPQCFVVEGAYIVQTDVLELYSALHITRGHRTEVTLHVLYMRAKWISSYKNRFSCFRICMANSFGEFSVTSFSS